MTGGNGDSLYDFVRAADSDDELRRLVLRLILKRKREQIQRAQKLGPGAGTAEKLNRRRFARSVAQKLRRSILGASRPPIAKDILAFRFGDHPVLQSLMPRRSRSWLPVLKRDRFAERTVISVPRLSFLHDPESAFRCLVEVAEAEAKALNVRLDFDFEYVEDIGPFLLLAEIWPYFAPVFTGGGTMYPAVQKVLEAVGLRRSLGMAFPGLADTQDVWALPVQRRRPGGRSMAIDRYLAPQTSEAAADRLCDEIDVWLDASGMRAELTDTGRREISQIVTEILDNAERHSSYKDKDGSWTMAAFMARRKVDDETRHICHIAFLSIGDTISDSLNATAPPDLRPAIDGFVQSLRKSGARQDQATLMTLAALQDGVTRDAQAYERGSGGYGLMEFIDSVNFLGSSKRPELKPRMAIVSGQSYISIREPYLQGVRRAGEQSRRLLFNGTNSANEPPDSGFVYDLPFSLPGTMISVAFTLDPDFYEAALNGQD